MRESSIFESSIFESRSSSRDKYTIASSDFVTNIFVDVECFGVENGTRGEWIYVTYSIYCSTITTTSLICFRGYCILILSLLLQTKIVFSNFIFVRGKHDDGICLDRVEWVEWVEENRISKRADSTHSTSSRSFSICICTQDSRTKERRHQIK